MPLPLKYLHSILQGQSPADFAAVGCLQPKRLWVYDAATATNRLQDVDCGECIRCSNQLRNEWVTRMQLHSYSYKHCYFVTLTYKCFDPDYYIKHPFKKDFLQTYPHFDSNNYTHRPGWSPTLLVNSHLAKFIKRLRKTMTLPLSYVACGELGSTYYRPHFHLILWTNDTLTREQIKDAWSLEVSVSDNDPRVVKKWTYNSKCKKSIFSIGRIDFHDLVVNGTLGGDGSNAVDRSSKKNFSYVAKYVGKRDTLPPGYIKYLWQVYRKLPFFEEKDILCNYSLDVPEEIYNTSDYGWKTYHKPSNNKDYDQLSFSKFKKLVSPFFVSSKLYCIGKDYALSNLNRFREGRFALPEVQNTKLTFPRYFARLASESLYPFRVFKTTPVGSSLVLGPLPNVRRYYLGLRDNPDFIDSPESVRLFPVEQLPPKYYDPASGIEIIQSPLDVYYLDPFIGRIRYSYSRSRDSFIGWIYDRSTRSYRFYNSYSREYFCNVVIWKTDSKISIAKNVADSALDKMALRDMIDQDENSFSRIENFKAIYNRNQRIYHSAHSLRDDRQ